MVATLVTAFFARRTGKGQVEAAKQAAVASERSAEAAGKSAEAAQEAVGVNRETAAGVAVRAEADARAKRYQDAAAQLGHEKAAVRLAGVYAMARLADDWPEQGQTCIDVLCAYLRMPWSPDEGNQEQAVGDYQVRRTIFYVIEQHTRHEAPISWSDNRFDLRYSILPPFEMHNVTFRSVFLLTGARFTGASRLENVSFEAGATFFQARIEGSLVLLDVVVNDGEIDFTKVTIPESAELVVQSDFIGPPAVMTLNEMTCDGTLEAHFLGASAPQGRVDALGVRVGETGKVVISQWPLVGQRIDPGRDCSFKVELDVGTWVIPSEVIANEDRLSLPPDVDTDSFTWA